MALFSLLNSLSGGGLPEFGLAIANLTLGLGLAYLILGYGTQTGLVSIQWLPG
jgi:hypothetical protein